MAARALASLSLSFGLVSIPIKLYSATESQAAVRFKLMARDGSRLRQQYVNDRDTADNEPAGDPGSRIEENAPVTNRPPASQGRSVAAPERIRLLADNGGGDGLQALAATYAPIVERSEMVKGYEFEKGKFVLFTAAELKALQAGARQTIDIVAFIPEHAVDPIYYDKAYFLAPDKRGGKTYSLLLAAMEKSGRSALAKWAWRSKEYVVQIRAAEGGLVLQQLLYADEVRSLADLDIDLAEVSEAELKLALQLIEQISADSYDPSQFVDEEKQRILAAVDRKIAGRKFVAPTPAEEPRGQVIDLMEVLRASLRTAKKPAETASLPALRGENPGPRKPARRAVKPVGESASAKARTRR